MLLMNKFKVLLHSKSIIPIIQSLYYNTMAITKVSKNLCPSSEYKSLVSSLRNKKDNIQKCQTEKNILHKCILCKTYLSSNQYSMILEKHIKDIFNIQKPLNSTSGDGYSATKGLSIEIKISLGTENGQLNFVQIRPDHDIDYYLFLAYNLYEGDEGKIYWLLCEPFQLYELIPEYGGYSHGTVKVLGKISIQNIFGKSREYSLRPNPTARQTTRARKLWDIMIEKFEMTEEEIKKIIN